MFLTPLTELSWAYQLHYYLSFRTYRRRPRFASSSTATSLLDAITEICHRHEYHLLQGKVYPDHLRCLISLQPSHAISKLVQTLKANSARLLPVESPLWAGGFLARAVGRMRIRAVRNYLEQQPQHHGYANRIRPQVFRYRAPAPVALESAHAVFDLSHHLCFATQFRVGVFTSAAGEALAHYWLKVAAKRGFVVDQISIVPDHVHMLVRTVPKLSIEHCALSLMNNGQYFIGANYPQLLVTAGIDQLWQASAYAGTCGEISTALIKHWLSG